jgi:hypothetical protein
MHRIDGLSKAQRVVVVIALGLGLSAVGSYLVGLGSGAGFGWTGYAPLTVQLYGLPGRGLHARLRVIIWLVLIGAWALASIRVLRPAADDAASD